MVDSVLRKLSHVAVPALAATSEEREGHLACQRLAQKAALEIASLIREGWTERQAANLLNEYLGDCGVKTFFHEGFAWFGDRTRFDGIRGYAQFSPSARVLQAGEVFILDVAPILDGYVCDIGYTGSLGPSAELDAARAFLRELRGEIPRWFTELRNGGAVWQAIDRRLRAAGWDNVHSRYPFSVVGHRVHRVSLRGRVGLLNFGWQSFWSLLSHGLMGQLLNGTHEGSLVGLWAIEPHIGRAGFGAKFEEILVVEPGAQGLTARWLDDKAPGLA